jgi:RHH-type proline utilization regulon transcriptional repressor/proline dehydrogenase/delta 1-pyrroline-5-carboxylate dehydrogenase
MTVPPIPSLLDAARAEQWDDERLAREAVALAAELLHQAKEHETRADHRNGRRMARMMGDPAGKAFTVALADQIFRPPTADRAADQFSHLVDGYGVPRYLGRAERAALHLGSKLAPILPRVIMPMVTEKLRADSTRMILPAEPRRLRRHLHRRRDEGTRLNLNQLGEAILGEEEAERRLQANLDRLADPDVEYISVKISSVFSQIAPLAFEHTVTEIEERLRRLYRAACRQTFTRADGTDVAKFVNLDMEEYRDLHLTVEAFERVLDEDEFRDLEAGIVLQAYLPDSFEVQQRLTRWALARKAAGGAGIKIRIVKGANLAMEQVEASLHGWEQAPYRSKAEVDANYKRMLRYGARREHAEAVRLGVASHNLFDIAYALLVRAREGTGDLVEFEMLEGMANHQAGVVQDVAGGMLLYAPVVRRSDFTSAISYLVRRLDENTAPENFLHDLFSMEVGTPAWRAQEARFLRACADVDQPATTPNRTQDRTVEETNRVADTGPAFTNEPDTDFVLAANRAWIERHLAVEAKRSATEPELIPLQIDGELVGDSFAGGGRNPSSPGHVAYRYELADAGLVDRALAAAVAAQPAWEDRGPGERRALLCEAAAVFGRRRGESVATMVHDGGKSVVEADPEVSEAIDFAAWYARAYDDLDADGAVPSALGVVVVTPPWNFPFAIPAGGVLAALMAGNTVILKPAPETVRTAWVLANQLWEAGIPQAVLQFVPCPDDDVGQALVTDPRTAAVVLTGAYETARMFQGWKPDITLFAETSGKNSLVITAAADPDQAVKDLVRSAFGHAGQKCSAASLAIVEGSLYDAPAFRRQLRDAVASLAVGRSDDPASVVTPVIKPPSGPLERGLTTLDEGEAWLVEPRMVDGNPSLWSPGVKLGVRPGSWYHRTECFGPVLGLMRADDLDHAIELQNASDFGLTGGIHSLDAREVEQWRSRVQVGNAYVNRGTTGAIVRRQPFGGWKRSAFGPGAKAGGPNYVLQFSTWRQDTDPADGVEPSPDVTGLATDLAAALPDGPAAATLHAAARSQAAAVASEFGVVHDPSQLHGETNTFRYRSVGRAVLRVAGPDGAAGTSDLAIAIVALAARTAGLSLEVSTDADSPVLRVLRRSGRDVRTETDGEFAARLATPSGPDGVVRHLGPVPSDVRRAAADRHLTVIDRAAVAGGRLELRWCFREQAISESTHRYGNVVVPPTGA